MSADDVHSPTSAGAVSASSVSGDAPTDKSPTFGDAKAKAGDAADVAKAKAGDAADAAKTKAADAVADTPLERPEVQVGAAFAGGFLFAMILKRLGS